jgi:DNA ligase 1
LEAIHTVLTRLESTSSRKKKVEILKSLSESTIDASALEVILYALDPFKTYGIIYKRFSSVNPIFDRSFVKDWPNLKIVLRDLLNRRLTGNAARSEIESWMQRRHITPILERILAKDLRAGIGSSTVNAAIHDAIPSFDVCLAKTFNKGKQDFPVWVEPKLDGVRTIAVIGDSGQVSLYSRNGKEYSNFINISKDLEALGLSKIVLDGEVVGKTFDQVMGVAHRKRGLDDRHLTYRVFDILSLEDFMRKSCKTPLHERHSILVRLLLGNCISRLDHIEIVQGVSVDNEHDLYSAYDDHVSNGYEGSMIKDPASAYEFKRSKSWLKLKPENTYDGRIFDTFEGEGKYGGMLGGLVVLINNVETKVGSGFSDLDRVNLWDNRKSLVGKYVEIIGQEMTKDGAIRFPRLYRFREDKN